MIKEIKVHFRVSKIRKKDKEKIRRLNQSHRCEQLILKRHLDKFIADRQDILANNMLWTKYSLWISKNIEKCVRVKISFDLFKRIMSSKCAYCNWPPSLIWSYRCDGEKYEIEHGTIDRVDNKKGYEEYNCLPACLPCNLGKNKSSIPEHCGYLNYVHCNRPNTPEEVIVKLNTVFVELRL